MLRNGLMNCWGEERRVIWRGDITRTHLCESLEAEDKVEGGCQQGQQGAFHTTKGMGTCGGGEDGGG